jgi:imidazolonepropionase-like amidohydrolase
VVDAHVHLAFAASLAALLAGGVTAVRDLGAPPDLAARWRTPDGPQGDSPRVAVAGPLLTAPGGYPSQSWGAAGFAAFVGDPAAARAVVAELVGTVDVVKVAIEPAAGPVPDDATVRAVVDAAHHHGLAVTAHTLSLGAVETAVAAGVDELAHTPLDPLPPRIVDAIAAAELTVVSTLQTFIDGDDGEGALANAAALLAAGVRLVYGTDLGNAGTLPGVDPRELDRLADAGLGREGALRAATSGSATAAGMHGGTGRLGAGEPADLVVLAADPLERTDVWRSPVAVLVGGRVATVT